MGDYVNISVVTYNRRELTQLAIKSLSEKTQYPYCITVVDNASTDGTIEYLKDLYHNGTIKNLMLLDKNIGIAGASNLAWQMEDTEFYMKYDNDMKVLKEGWLSDMVDAMSKVNTLGMLGYNVEPYNFKITEVDGVRFRLRNTIGGAMTLIPKRVWDKIGYWYEDYNEYGEEDTDYGLRVNAIGSFCAYMESNNVALHLQASKEDSDPKYRKWKDNCRQNNKNKFLENERNYTNGKNIKAELKSRLDDYRNFIYTGDQ